MLMKMITLMLMARTMMVRWFNLIRGPLYTMLRNFSAHGTHWVQPNPIPLANFVLPGKAAELGA